ncbi:Rpp14/Pop5 family protein [Halosimplex salinum]|uniref:Rpp14/Pop5 family protein n=1 Tax=Halosimplex salinum TaxID=1710538 RepID=UPI000F4A662D|nr:Rpp14/Pop5 family protein [Halosimplex salinum]
MKHLPKHLQPRWRYLAVELEGWPDASFGRGTFQRDLWFAAQNLVGDTGSAEVDLSVLRFAFEDGAGHAIVRARRGETDRARAVLACLDAVDGDEVGVRVRGVSGTVRACEEKYIRSPPEPTDQRNVVFENAERRAVARDGRIDVRTDDAFVGATELDL